VQPIGVFKMRGSLAARDAGGEAVPAMMVSLGDRRRLLMDKKDIEQVFGFPLSG
jgi:hypothetical protein